MRFSTSPDPLETVEKARDAYLAENGFTTDEYTAPSFRVPFGPWVLRLPNPPARQRTVCLHDLHHVLTGYGTDPIGEVEVSAWEVGGGLGGLWIAWVICGPVFVWGLLRYRRRTWAAYRKGRHCRSLLAEPAAYPDLLGLTLAELRERAGLPPHGAADRPGGLNRLAPDRPVGLDRLAPDRNA